MSGKYILNGHVPELCEHVIAWADWFEKADRHVASDEIGDVKISTVFIGLDRSFGIGPPLLFETMIFGGEHDEEQWRCTTWEEAEKQHAHALALVKGDAAP